MSDAENRPSVTVNGYQLRAAIQRHELRRNTATAKWPKSLKAFPDENKERPESISDALQLHERNLARLQTAQVLYNILVRIDVDGESILLMEAIKRAGGLKRLAALWKAEAAPTHSRYATRDDDVRKADQIRAVPVLQPDEAASVLLGLNEQIEQLNRAIAKGNETLLKMDLDESHLR